MTDPTKKNDLSEYLPMHFGEHDDKRTLDGFLTFPAWTKHDRTYSMWVEKPDGTKKFKGKWLTPLAKEYRAHVCGCRLVYPGPIIRAPYVIDFLVFSKRFDCDQWSGGLTDDLVEAGFLEDDRNAVSIHSDVKRSPEEIIYFTAHEV
jgi:hypothetical protein